MSKKFKSLLLLKLKNFKLCKEIKFLCKNHKKGHHNKTSRTHDVSPKQPVHPSIISKAPKLIKPLYIFASYSFSLQQIFTHIFYAGNFRLAQKSYHTFMPSMRINQLSSELVFLTLFHKSAELTRMINEDEWAR